MPRPHRWRPGVSTHPAGCLPVPRLLLHPTARACPSACTSSRAYEAKAQPAYRRGVPAAPPIGFARMVSCRGSRVVGAAGGRDRPFPWSTAGTWASPRRPSPPWPERGGAGSRRRRRCRPDTFTVPPDARPATRQGARLVPVSHLRGRLAWRSTVGGPRLYPSPRQTDSPPRPRSAEPERTADGKSGTKSTSRQAHPSPGRRRGRVDTETTIRKIGSGLLRLAPWSDPGPSAYPFLTTPTPPPILTAPRARRAISSVG